MYNSRDVEIHVGLECTTPVPQKEIVLSDFDFCYSCRTGACPKHEGPVRSSQAEGQQPEQKQECTRQGVSILTKLPVELACQVALALPCQTFFSIRHIPELEAFWAANGDYLVREKADQFAAEAHVFPASLFTGGAGSVLATHQQLLYLEVIRTTTAAVTDYFTTTLDLPADLSARLRFAILHLWRVVGVPHRSSRWRTRQEAMNYFCSLPQAERADIFALFADVGECIDRAHPFSERRRADNVLVDDVLSDEMMDDIRASGAWTHACGFLAMESIRAAMRGAFALAGAGGCNDVDADAVEEAVGEMRLGAPLWTVWDPDDEWVNDPDNPFFRTDKWGYWISMDPDPAGTIDLKIPAEHAYGYSSNWLHDPHFYTRDDYMAFGLAKLLPDGWTLDTRRYYHAFDKSLSFSKTAVGAKCGSWGGPMYKFDQQHASDEDKAELMEALMEIAFKLVPDESQ